MSRPAPAVDKPQVDGRDPMKQWPTGPRLSAVVPVYNEVGTIAEVVRRVQDVCIEKEIIIVDDGSGRYAEGSRAPIIGQCESGTALSGRLEF